MNKYKNINKNDKKTIIRSNKPNCSWRNNQQRNERNKRTARKFNRRLISKHPNKINLWWN